MARPSRGPDDHVKCRISDEVLPIVQLFVVFCQFLHQVAPVCNYVVDFRGAVWAALGPKAIFMPSYMARMFQQSAEGCVCSNRDAANSRWRDGERSFGRRLLGLPECSTLASYQKAPSCSRALLLSCKSCERWLELSVMPALQQSVNSLCSASFSCQRRPWPSCEWRNGYGAIFPQRLMWRSPLGPLQWSRRSPHAGLVLLS